MRYAREFDKNMIRERAAFLLIFVPDSRNLPKIVIRDPSIYLTTDKSYRITLLIVSYILTFRDDASSHIDYMQQRAAVIRKFLIRCHDAKRNHAEVFSETLHDDNRQICINYQLIVD